MISGSRGIAQRRSPTVAARSARRQSHLEDAVDRQRLRAFAGGKDSFKELIAPVSGEPAIADAQRYRCSNLVGMVQLELGEPCSNVGLSHEDPQTRVLIEVIAVGVEENWQVADAQDFECQRIAMWISAGEFGQNVK